MRSSPIRVGLVGFNPPRSWAAVAHLPALRMLDDRFEIAGIANSSLESSVVAAAHIGVTPFASVADLAADPTVDLVAVTVKVPHHAAAVRTALAAGKAVLCEWPLARTLAEAYELAALARDSGRPLFVGTQAVLAPAVQALRDLVFGGRLGAIRSSSLIGFGMTWGPTIEARNAYLLDRENGATLLTIPVGHALSAVLHVLGPVSSVQAAITVGRDAVAISETGEQRTMTAPDDVAVLATTASGVPVSVHFRAGAPRGLGLCWQIDGTERSARLTAPSGLIEMTALTLEVSTKAGGWEVVEQPVDHPVWDGVARLYAGIADTLQGNEPIAPTAQAGLALHRLLDAIERAGASGQRVAID